MKRNLVLICLIVGLNGCGRRGAPPLRDGEGAHSVGAGAKGGAELTVVTEDARLRSDDALPATSPIFDGTRVRLRGGRGETLAMHVVTRGHDAVTTLALHVATSGHDAATAPAGHVTAGGPDAVNSRALHVEASSHDAANSRAAHVATSGLDAVNSRAAHVGTSGLDAANSRAAHVGTSGDGVVTALPAQVATSGHDVVTTPALNVARAGSPVSAAAADAAAAAVRIDAFAVQWLNLREPSTAMYGQSRGAGVYPDPLCPSVQPVRGDALFDVAIAADAAPGVYFGTLTVGARQLPVELTVEPVQLAVGDDPLVWIWYMPREIARAHGLPDDDRALLPLEQRYHELARAHGAYLASDLPLDRFLARQSLMSGTRYWPVEIDLSSLQSAQRDVQQWLNQFATRPQTAFTIPIDEPHSAAERAATRAAGERIGRHDKLLRAVTAPPNSDFGDAIDVFIGPASRPPHRWTYNGTPPAAGSMIIDGAGPSLRTWGWIAARYGVELWYAWEGTYFADRYNGGGPTDVLTDPLTFDQRRKRLRNPDWGNGDGVLFYPSPPPVGNLPSSTVGESPSTTAGKMPSSTVGESPSTTAGKMQSSTVGESPSTTAGKVPSATSGRSPSAASGELSAATAGHAASSSLPPTVGEPWPSLRLKALRRGLQDRLLLRALERCGAGDAATAAMRALVPRALDEGVGAAAWPDDPAAWEAARGRLYDVWRARCGAPHG